MYLVSVVGGVRLDVEGMPLPSTRPYRDSMIDSARSTSALHTLLVCLTGSSIFLPFYLNQHFLPIFCARSLPHARIVNCQSLAVLDRHPVGITYSVRDAGWFG